MHFVLTSAGAAYVAANPGVPPQLAMYKLGDAFNYLPDPSDLGLRGGQVFSGVPSAPVVQFTNLVKYSIHLDSTVGDFGFGEVGLYLPGDVLFALGSSTSLIMKTQSSGTIEGNNLVIDCYLSTVGSDYRMFAELGNSALPLNLSALPGVDTLPSAVNAYPNIYLIGSPDSSGSILAYSDNAAWNFTGYEEIVSTGIVLAATPTSVTLATDQPAPNFYGELLIEIMDGPAMGSVRIISGYASISKTYSVTTGFVDIPIANSSVRVLKKTQLRPHVAAILAGLDTALTAGHLNDLILNPPTGFFKKDGSSVMLGPINSGGHRIVNVSVPLLDTDAANKFYVDQQLTISSASLSALSALVTQINANYYRRDGAAPMTGPVNFGGYKGINVATPTVPSDAATMGWTQNAIATAVGSLITNHNTLPGLQGGNGSTEYYHLTANERNFVSNLVNNGYPNASYTARGVTMFADAVTTGAGLDSTRAITPESLYLALAAAVVNPVQSAILGFVGNNLSGIQTGLGDPNGATPVSPSIYLDVATNPSPMWVYISGVWRKILAHQFQVGTGAPDGTTNIAPPVYFDSTDPLNYVQYVYSAGAWRKSLTAYVQSGTGAPTVATPTDPRFYVDTSVVPNNMYFHNGISWNRTSADSVDITDLYFYGQM